MVTVRSYLTKGADKSRHPHNYRLSKVTKPKARVPSKSEWIIRDKMKVNKREWTVVAKDVEYIADEVDAALRDERRVADRLAMYVWEGHAVHVDMIAELKELQQKSIMVLEEAGTASEEKRLLSLQGLQLRNEHKDLLERESRESRRVGTENYSHYRDYRAIPKEQSSLSYRNTRNVEHRKYSPTATMKHSFATKTSAHPRIT
uniref:Uncharacterized protein n=1 Tax=Panagrolaimus sp. ES5 TaxID=591445 RepID=A0AC34G443_9BILA